MGGVAADFYLAGGGEADVPGVFGGGALSVEGRTHVTAGSGLRGAGGVRQGDGRFVCRLLFRHGCLSPTRLGVIETTWWRCD
jgi:hypothetical protein